jgi:hypothetical protein
MSRTFDRNGVFVSKSTPSQKLQTVKKTLTIDSGDRDVSKYFTNGDFVIYLPRVYENVVSIRLMSGEFPALVYTQNAAAFIHYYKDSPNFTTNASKFLSDNPVGIANGLNPFYFFLDIEGLNKTDETVVGANGSGLIDSFFAKIPAVINSSGFIEYNDHSGQDNIAKYTPPIKKLDRLHIRSRLHSKTILDVNTQASDSFIYWTSDGNRPYVSNVKNMTNAEFSLTFEIEYLDNVFDDFSSFETRLDRT